MQDFSGDRRFGYDRQFLGQKQTYCSEQRFEGPPGKPGYKRLVQAIVGTNRKAVVSAITRGTEGKETLPAILPDGVLKLDGQRIDLSPLFANRPNATYLVSLRKFQATDPVIDNRRFTWNRATPMPLSVDAIPAGLYTLEVHRDEELDREFEPSWVLIVPAERFAGVLQDYREVLALMESWPGEPDDRSKARFRRAALETLASPDVEQPR